MEGPAPWNENNIIAWVILGYLCSHPDAKDTGEGICHWWLTSEGIEVDPDVVRRSIEYLENLGWLTATKANGGGTLYGLNLNRRQALQRFLRLHSSMQ